jgi:AbrB family looped-hinge helix DNA binding protein
MKFPDGRDVCTVKIGEKGQIVIPKNMRDMFDIKAGDTLLLLADRERGIAIVNDTGFLNGAFGSAMEGKHEGH